MKAEHEARKKASSASIVGKSVVEGVRPVPSLTGLSVPIVGQFYKSGSEQTLRAMGEGDQIYLHPEPTNPYDRNAQKVVVFRNGAR